MAILRDARASLGLLRIRFGDCTGSSLMPLTPYHAFRKGSISFSISSIETSPMTRLPLMKKVGVDSTLSTLAARSRTL